LLKYSPFEGEGDRGSDDDNVINNLNLLSYVTTAGKIITATVTIMTTTTTTLLIIIIIIIIIGLEKYLYLLPFPT
jgi:hypothetical protein